MFELGQVTWLPWSSVFLICTKGQCILLHTVGAQQILYFIPLASSSCACVYTEGWRSSGFCYKFWYESISKSAGFHFRAGHSAFSERTVSGLNCPLNCMLRWQQSQRRDFFTNRPQWNRAWLENRMNKLAQLANSLHSLTLICTKGGSQSSQHKWNPPKDGHDSLSAVHSPQPAQILLQVGF